MPSDQKCDDQVMPNLAEGIRDRNSVVLNNFKITLNGAFALLEAVRINQSPDEGAPSAIPSNLRFQVLPNSIADLRAQLSAIKVSRNTLQLKCARL
jgi:hypothetical protein